MTPTTTVGQLVWWARFSDAAGPYPAVVLVPGELPLLLVHFPDFDARMCVTPWDVEDGTDHGWCEIPPDGQVPADFFEAP